MDMKRAEYMGPAGPFICAGVNGAVYFQQVTSKTFIALTCFLRLSPWYKISVGKFKPLNV